MSDQTGTCSDKHQFWLENVRCLTTISSTGLNLVIWFWLSCLISDSCVRVFWCMHNQGDCYIRVSWLRIFCMWLPNSLIFHRIPGRGSFLCLFHLHRHFQLLLPSSLCDIGENSWFSTFHVIMHHLDQTKILNNYQHAFRSKYLCQSQLVTPNKEIFKVMDQQKQIDLILLDFPKLSTPRKPSWMD